MSRRDRYRRAKLAGASTLNREEWKAIVDRAAATQEAKLSRYRFDSPELPAVHREREQPIWLGPDQMVVDARMILNVEAEFALAEEIQDEIREAAAADLSESRRARLLRTLDELRERIAKRPEPS